MYSNQCLDCRGKYVGETSRLSKTTLGTLSSEKKTHEWNII